MYFSKYFIAVSVSQLWYTFACGYLENLSTEANIYESLFCSSSMGPAKSIWISSFGSCSGGRFANFDFGIIGFKFLPIFMHGWQFCVRVTISLWILGNHIMFAKCIIPDWPG